MPGDAHESNHLPPADEDLYCLHCRYNLRGLPGDPIRCPECFHEYTRAALRAGARKRILTRLERIRRDLDATATLCALPVGVSVLVPLTHVLANGWFDYVKVPFGLTASVIWLSGFVLFATRCWGIAGWLPALVKYHLWVAPAMTAYAVMMVVGISVTMAVTIDAAGMGFLVGLAGMLALLLRFKPMRWVTRWGTAGLEPLAQEIANRPPDAP